MIKQKKQCLYCNSQCTIEEGSAEPAHCSNCGMLLPERDPHDRTFKQKLFKVSFFFIVVFCLIMVFWLPR